MKGNVCYYAGNSLEIEDYHDDPLCMHWEGEYCEVCVPGTRKSTKTGLCTINDPHCIEYDGD